MLNTKRKFIYYALLAILVFTVDRITKLIVLNIAEENGSLDLYVNSFLNLYLVWNQGIGFGLFSFEQNNIYNFITLLILIINLIILYMIYLEKTLKAFFLVIIFGGSSGNLFDRIYYSAVPDFIDINYKGFHWFIFNFADIFISLGIICLILVELVKIKKNEK